MTDPLSKVYDGIRFIVRDAQPSERCNHHIRNTWNARYCSAKAAYAVEMNDKPARIFRCRTHRNFNVLPDALRRECNEKYAPKPR